MCACLGFYWTEEVCFAENIYFRTHNKFSVLVFGDCGCKYTTDQATNLNNKSYLFHFRHKKPQIQGQAAYRHLLHLHLVLPLSYIYIFSCLSDIFPAQGYTSDSSRANLNDFGWMIPLKVSSPNTTLFGGAGLRL